MRLKIAIVIIVAMVLAMPFTHGIAWKMGRTSDYQNVTSRLGVTEEKNIRVGEYVFTKRGIFDPPSEEHQPIQVTCGNCHEGRV